MQNLLPFVDTEKIKKVEDSRIYNSLDSTRTSDYYAQAYDNSTQVPDKGAYHAQVKEMHEQAGTIYKIMEELVSFLEGELKEDSVVIEIGGGSSQERSVNAYKRFKYYYPLDISSSNIGKYTRTYEKIGFIADAEALPFHDNSIDCIFTHNFLEHPIHPDKVLEEVARVIKPGGIIVHNDAWFCRWWQTYGIVDLKPFGDMTFKEKCIYLAAKFTEIPLVRIPPIIIRRAIRHFFFSNRKNIQLQFKKLTPNYTLFLGCDENAASSIDPIDVVRFYESRGFSLLKKLSLKERLFFPNKYICIKKTL